MMRATLESITDAVLVTDEEGAVAELNENYLELWSLPRAELERARRGEAHELASRSLAEPRRFLDRMREIAATAQKSFDLLELRDGRIFGYTAEEMIGSSIMRLIPSDRQDEEREILTRIRRGDRLDHFETIRRAKDGRPLNVSVTVSPIKDSTGQVIGASKVARDITERKEAEEILRQAMAAAETANQERLQCSIASARHDPKPSGRAG